MSQALERMVGESVRGLLSCDYDAPRPALALPATRQAQDLIYGALVRTGMLSPEFLTGASMPSRNR